MFGLRNLLSDSKTSVNSMINRRVSLFYQVLFESIPPYGLSVYLIECLFLVCPQKSELAGQHLLSPMAANIS